MTRTRNKGNRPPTAVYLDKVTDLTPFILTEPAQHTLTYPVHQKPAAGQLMGPGLDGRVWKVVESMYDPQHHVTSVLVEELVHAEEAS